MFVVILKSANIIYRRYKLTLIVSLIAKTFEEANNSVIKSARIFFNQFTMSFQLFNVFKYKTISTLP